MGFEAINAVLPDQTDQINRLQYLLAEARLPVVSVIGKYNHGKSSLLNALVECEQFAVSDARETTALSDFEYQGVRWLDTPGLDADVGQVVRASIRPAQRYQPGSPDFAACSGAQAEDSTVERPLAVDIAKVGGTRGAGGAAGVCGCRNFSGGAQRRKRERAQS